MTKYAGEPNGKHKEPDGVVATLLALRAENERLRGLIEKAHSEGYEDAIHHNAQAEWAQKQLESENAALRQQVKEMGEVTKELKQKV